MLKITIQKAENSNGKIIRQLNQALFEFEDQFTNTYNTNWSHSSAGNQYFQDRIKNGIVFIATKNEKVVGYTCGSIAMLSYRSPSKTAELENMFVLDSYRNLGIGKELLMHFEKEARALNAQRIVVSALNENRDAVEFYQDCGFSMRQVVLEKEY